MDRQLLDVPWKPTAPARLAELLNTLAKDARSRSPLLAAARRFRVQPLRSPRTAFSKAKSGADSTPPLKSLVFSRAAYGPTPADIAEFRGMGSDDRQRLEAWVEWQLEPDAIDDAELESRIHLSGYQTLEKSLSGLWNQYLRDEDDVDNRFLPIYESQLASILRAVYSRRQLNEVLVDFWHNHFNVYGFHFFVAPVFVHYDRDVIRANCLGNYRQFLEAMTTSAAMMFYLDNVLSSADGPNENFARELLELHTLGEENYWGAIPSDLVPTGPDGVPVGYTDEDVRELARCLTGWSLNENNGEFLYRGYWHDQRSKRVLGLEIPAYQAPLKDVRDVLDRLANHPGVASFVCTKLCRRLIGDNPPRSVVDAAVSVFRAAIDEPDQLKQVVRTIILSDEFASSWGDKIKRPFELVMSSVRAMGPDFELPWGADFSRIFFYLLYTTGHLPYSWAPPTGFPDRKEVWLTTNAQVTSWRLVNLLAGLEFEGERPCDPVASTPDGLETAAELADYWIDRTLLRSVNAGERTTIVEFMAQGADPDTPLATNSRWVAERLRSMVGLILMSPQAQWR
jgi:uncharacterized protein (DUF1800 family)